MAGPARGSPPCIGEVVVATVIGAVSTALVLGPDGWSHAWMVHPWTQSMLPEALLAALMAVAAGTIGGFAGRALTFARRPARARAVLGAAPGRGGRHRRRRVGHPDRRRRRQRATLQLTDVQDGVGLIMIVTLLALFWGLRRVRSRLGDEPGGPPFADTGAGPEAYEPSRSETSPPVTPR